jgi:cyclomaltodextrinase / maltogenic alpha-amylase / neopullulanase
MSYKILRDLMTKSVMTTLLISTVPHIVAAQVVQTRDFSKETARTSPDWVRDAVIYEIFPRQYSQKGDFNSITADLDRLKETGVTVLWLMPIHPIGREKAKGTIGSPYAVRDYYAINPDYGTPADFKRLVAEAHKRGLKVIIDIVANHTAWDSVMMKNKSFYTTDKAGNIIPPVPDWADVADLNFDNPELKNYMIDVLKFWVREYDLDGYRCDVAGFVPTDFWETARAEVDKIKKDTIWLAEWESPDLLTKAFDLDYSWAMHSALTEVFQGRRAATRIRETWETDRAKMPKGAIRMRFSDNHDERRAIARFGERGALAAQALVFTLDGVPLVYNGMEVGDTSESGYPALFERVPIFWQTAVRRPEFPRFYKAMTALRKSSPALRRGDLTWLRNSDENRILTFARRDSAEEILIAINTSGAPFVGTIEAAGNFEDVTPDISAPLLPGQSAAENQKKPTVALPAIALDSWGYRIFRRRN